MDRRSFLKGSVAVVATVIAVPMLPEASSELMVYGRSSAMAVLSDLQFLEGLSQKIAHTIIYGNPEYMPTQYTGLVLRYDARA